MAFGGIKSLGALRYLVTLATRISTPDGNGGFTETFVNPLETYADITPIGLQTFLGAVDTSTPITHRVFMRHQEGLDEFDVLLRDLVRADGSHKQELYRIRRVADWEGRQRFTCLEVELEKRADG